jgi:exonuclease III
MTLRVATWNINSVRLRAEQAARFAQEAGIDVLCLQEIKCRDGEFPAAAFIDAGLPHLKIKGQKGWHGVAIASRLPIQAAPLLDLCKRGEARAVSGVVAGVEIQNFYIPAGGDVADPAVNPSSTSSPASPPRLLGATQRRRFSSRATSTSRRASTTCGTIGICQKWSATRRWRSRRWRACAPPSAS